MALEFSPSLPSWLQAPAPTINTAQTGQMLGLLAAAAQKSIVNANKDESDPTRENKSFSDYWMESKLNLTDPLWREKADALHTENQLRNMALKDQIESRSEISGLLMETKGDPVAISNRVYGGNNPFTRKAWEDIQASADKTLAVREASDAAHAQAKTRGEDAANYTEGLRMLRDPAARARISAMAPPGPPTEAQFVELRAALEKENQQPPWIKEVKPFSNIGDLQADLTKAKARGDTEAVKQLEAAIAEATTNKGQSIFMGYDDQGRAIFQMASGGATPITVATRSQAQQKLLKYENSTEILNYLEKNLKPEHVGARGTVGEFVNDRLLAQLSPEFANKDRISVRSTLTAAREGLLREISDDTRFSNLDRAEIAKALPSSGAFESYADAMARIKRVREILAARGKVYSSALGTAAHPPLWTLSPEEIKALYQTPTNAPNHITEEEAIDALKRFH